MLGMGVTFFLKQWAVLMNQPKKSLQDVIGRSFLSLCWINQPIFGLNWLGGTRNVGGLAISGPRPLRFSGDLEATFEGKTTKLPQVGPRTKAPARYQAPLGDWGDWDKYISDIPYLKLTVCIWKWMVGILASFWDGLFSGAMSVSRGCTLY